MNYNLDEKAIIWINFFEFLTLDKKHAILEFYEQPQDIFSSFKHDYLNFQKIITKEQFERMCDALDENFINSEIVNLDKDNIQVVTYVSEFYPKDFLNYNGYPVALYCKGDVSLMKSYSIAVVGTRKITKYGAFVTEKICRELAQNGITIISGMASGVDTVAHTTALKNNAQTIAVLGSGFNHIYPKTNFELYKQICENGLVISEYTPQTLPATYNFPVRNRIIAMLSKGVLITEAGLKSGAIYTVNYGLDYGKEIFAVPGNIDSYSSIGCNNVLKSCQSALTTCADDIFKVLHIDNKSQKVNNKVQISLEEQTILNVLGNDELSFDEIVSQTNYDTKTLVRLLTTLELSGIIKKSAGNFYSKILQD